MNIWFSFSRNNNEQQQEGAIAELLRLAQDAKAPSPLLALIGKSMYKLSQNSFNKQVINEDGGVETLSAIAAKVIDENAKANLEKALMFIKAQGTNGGAGSKINDST